MGPPQAPQPPRPDAPAPRRDGCSPCAPDAAGRWQVRAPCHPRKHSEGKGRPRPCEVASGNGTPRGSGRQRGSLPLKSPMGCTCCAPHLPVQSPRPAWGATPQPLPWLLLFLPLVPGGTGPQPKPPLPDSFTGDRKARLSL